MEYKPLMVVLSEDAGLPIYYSPPEDMTLILSQTLSAILLGVRELDEEQIEIGFKSLERFLKEYHDRKVIYHGAGILILLPKDYKGKEYLEKVKNTLKRKFGSEVHIKFWDEFNKDYKIILFSMDLQLRREENIKEFLKGISEDLEKWSQKNEEYRSSGIVLITSPEVPSEAL